VAGTGLLAHDFSLGSGVTARVSSTIAFASSRMRFRCAGTESACVSMPRTAGHQSCAAFGVGKSPDLWRELPLIEGLIECGTTMSEVPKATCSGTEGSRHLRIGCRDEFGYVHQH